MKLEYVNSSTNDSREITSYTNNYKRSDNTDTLGEEFTFDLVSNSLDINMKDLKLAIGGKITFHNDVANNNRTSTNDSRTETELKKVFTGIVVKSNKKGLSQYSYTCYDYAFYLNKSEADIQYNNIDGTTAIRQLCSKYGIPLGSVPILTIKVKKVYEGTVISDVVKDILKMQTDSTGYKYRIEVREGQLFIEDYKELVLDVEITNIVADFTHEESMEDMKNQILIVSSSEKHEQVLAISKDDESIKKYGLLQKVEKIEDKKKDEAKKIAAQHLKELNQIKGSLSVTVLGDDTVRSGRTLKFNQPELDFIGSFLIKNCTHNYGINHTMNLELREVK